MGGNKGNGATVFSVIHSERTRSYGHKFKYRKFHLNIRKKPFPVKLIKHWNSLLREVAEFAFMELLKTHLDTALSNLL